MTSAKGSVIASVYLSVSKVTQNVMNRFSQMNNFQGTHDYIIFQRSCPKGFDYKATYVVLWN